MRYVLYKTNDFKSTASHPIFPIGLVKTKSDFTVRSVETCLGRSMLVVAVISVDAYPFFGFLRPDLSP